MKDSAIVAADCHLVRRPGMWGREEIGGDDEYSFKQICEFAYHQDSDLFLLGDVIDSPTITPRPMAIAKRFIEQVANKGLHVGYIQGQHELVIMDEHNNVPWLSLIDGTSHMHGQQFEFLGFKAFALDYFPQPMAALAMSKVPDGTEVLFVHATVDQVTPFGAQLEIALVPESVKYLFAGDFHQALELDLGRLKLYYNGSAWLKAIDEPWEKSVMKVSKSGSGLEVERLKLDTRPVVQLSKVEDLKMLESLVHPTLGRPVVVADREVDSASRADLAKVAYVYTPASTTDSGLIDKEEVVEEEDDRDVLARYLDPQNEQAFRFTLDVLRNPPQDSLERLRKELELPQQSPIL